MKGIAQTQSFTDLIDSGYIYIDKTREGLHIKAQTLREIPDA